jgi:hypothetical protein
MRAAARPRATVRALLRLYPRAWRDRYADEMSAMLADVALSPASMLDLVAGAIDARVAPQPIRGSDPGASPDKEKAMFTKLMKRCAVGPDVTPREKWLGTTAMLVLTLVFAVVYVLASWKYRDNEYVDAWGVMAFPAAMLLTMPLTYLKGHSRTSQVVIIGGCLLFLMLMSIVAARI